MKPARQRIVAAIALAIAAVATIAPAARSDSQTDKIKEAAEQSSRAAKAFDAIMKVPDKATPRDLLSRAKAVAVFPRVIKVALTVGGEGGRGVVLRPEDDLNKAVYNQDARELLSDQAAASGPSEGLNSFPDTLGRYTSKSSNDQ